MPNCSYTLRTGRSCLRNATQDGMCRQHWRMSREHLTVEQNQAPIVHQNPAEHPNVTVRQRRQPRAIHLPQQLEVRRPLRVEVRYREFNREFMENVPNMSLLKIAELANYIFDMWTEYEIPGLNIPAGYSCLKNLSIRNPHYNDMVHVCAQLYLLNKHPVFVNYGMVPQEEREEVLNRLGEVLDEIGDAVPHFDDSDWRITLVLERSQQEIEQAHVFERDPEGGINLRAFANDAENVHRSSVQSMANKQIHHILRIPLPEEQDTLLEVHRAIKNERALAEVRLNWDTIECFQTTYRLLLAHIVAYIQTHQERDELIRRLEEEIVDGIDTCPNGKMCRLVNVLQGYYEMPTSGPSREEFQHRIAEISRLSEGRREAAEAAFDEYNIPAEERETWLEALMTT
jgi:hypothetical protein